MAKLLLALAVFTSLALLFYKHSSLTSPPSVNRTEGGPGRRRLLGVPAEADFTLTILSAPKRFGPEQRNAVLSWLALRPTPEVVLLGVHPVLGQAAAELGVKWEPFIDHNFVGVPFFHSMISRARVSNSTIAVLIDSETILLPDFTALLARTQSAARKDWLLMGSAWKVPSFPFTSNRTQGTAQRTLLRAIRDGTPQASESSAWSAWEPQEPSEVRSWVNRTGRQPDCDDGVGFWAWDVSSVPLHSGLMPPFVFQKGSHDQWLLHEAVTSGARTVVDVTPARAAVKVDVTDVADQPLANDPNNTRWERQMNAHLAFSHGTFSHQQALENRILAPWQLAPCSHSDTIPLALCFFKRTDIDKTAQTVDTKDCKNDKFLADNYSGGAKKTSPLAMPMTLADLLPKVADENKTVVLTVVAYNYAEGLMTFACRLRNLNMTNLIVGAVDPKMHHYASEQGLPVFADLSDLSFHPDKCHFPSKCFTKVTKLKSRTVRRVLKMGYNVLMSDVDVIFFQNPFPYLYAYGPNTIVGQSDQWNDTGPSNDIKRFNSGFYFAQSDNRTIEVMEKIGAHAALSDLSEQPSFWVILCGPDGKRKIGWDECVCQNGLRAIFLDRNKFPNGATAYLWDRPNTNQWLDMNGAVILHNNWVQGRKPKFMRWKEKGFWNYVGHARMCHWHWYNSSRLTIY